MNKKNENIEVLGTITEALPGRQYKVELENGHIITGIISGKMRMNHINLVPGDTVTVEMTPYDLDKGRIIYRGQKK